MKAVPTLQSLKAMLQDQAPVRHKREFGSLKGKDLEGPTGATGATGATGVAGIPLHAGQIIEVLGRDQIGWAVRFLKDRPLDSRAAWLMVDAIEVFPMGLAQEQIALSRILFLERVKPEQGMEVLLSVLRSQLFEVVLFEQPLLPVRNLDAQMRKLQLTAEESGSLLLLLSKRPTSSFGIRVQVVSEARGQTEFRKVKGGTGQ